MHKKEKIKIHSLKKILSSCLFLIATAFCYGQTTLLSGVITNEKKELLQNASIIAKQGVIIKAFTNSKSNGQFELKLNSNLTYTIEISSIGYEKISEILTTNSSPINKSFTLIRKNTPEDTVNIVAKKGVYEKDDTIFYNADVFKKNNENNLKDLLNNMPGIIVTSSGKIIADGQMVSKVLIDGKDLTGENYEKIVNNLSPHGLDQIQVLKKYKDPFELSNSATGNTEVALNLTFKNKKIIPNAKVSLSAGVPLKYYEQKTDFLILTKPITAINFININTIGNTAQLITSPNSLFGNFTNELFRKLGKGLPYQNSVPELFLKINKNYYSFNNTKFFDNSSQFNIGKKITDKFSINYTPEKIEQTETGYSRTFVDNQLIAETNSLSNPIIKRKEISIKNELIWMLQKNEQIKWNSNLLSQKEVSINNSIINSKFVDLNTRNSKNFGNTLINYTKFLKNATIINLAGFFDTQKNVEQLSNEGILYNNTIINNSLGQIKSLSQNLQVLESNYGSYFKLVKRKNDYSITIQPTYKKIIGKLASSLSALATTNINYSNLDSFENNFTYLQNSFSMPMQYRYDNNDFIFNFSLEPLYFTSSIFNTHNTLINYNASINANYQFKNKRRINVSISRNNDFSNLTKMFAANTLVNNTSVFKQTNFLLKQQSYSFNLSSFRFGSYSNKPNFSYNLFSNINTPNYLLNNTSNNFYAIQNYFQYNIINKSITGVIRNNFTVDKLNIRFENDFNLSTRNANTSQNNNIVASISSGYQLTNRVITKWKSSLNFQLNNTVAYNTNKRLVTSFVNKSISNITGFDINYNYRKKSHLDIEAKNFYFNTFNAQIQNIFLVNVSYKQLFHKNKIRFNIDFRNITNKKSFLSQNISITNFSENQVLLLPFMALLKVEFLL